MVGACGPLTSSTLDDGTRPIEPPFRVAEPTLPANPIAPVLNDPLPMGGTACPLDQAHFAGTAGCALVGEACGADDWATQLPNTSPILYVKAGAALGGAGTRGAPFGSVDQALAAARSGDIVALSKGDFTTRTRVGPGVTVWGACVAQTSVRAASDSPLVAVFESTSPGVVVRNLRVTGPRVGLAAGLSSASVLLENVVLERAVGQGLSAQRGAKIALASVVVRDTQPSADGTFGAAVGADSGGQISGQRIVIDGAFRFGVFALEAATSIALQDLVVTRVRGQVSDRGFGYGFRVEAATLRLERAVIEDVQGNGVFCGLGATCDLIDTSVTGVIPSGADPTICAGVRIASARLRANRLVVQDTPGWGVLVGGTEADVALTDTLVQRIPALEGGATGLATLEGAKVVGTRLAIQDIDGPGVSVAGMSAFDATDLTVSKAYRSGQPSFGMSVIESSSAVLERAKFDQTNGPGVIVGGTGVRFSAKDLQVSNQVNEAVDQGGGVVALAGASVAMTRTRISGVSSTGLYAAQMDTFVTAEDLTIEEMRLSGSRPGAFGVFVGDNATLLGSRVRVASAQLIGVFVAGGVVTLDAVTVKDTGLPACTDTRICNGERNAGLLATKGGKVTLQSFMLLNNGGFGVLLDQGEADLSDGLISGHTIGANVIDPNFDVSRLSLRVAYRNNGRKLDAAKVPVPSVPPPPQVPRP